MAFPRKVEISHRTIVFAAAFLILLWFLFIIRDIILMFFVALLIMAVLNPWVTKLSKYKVPRAASVLVVYLVIFGLVAVTVAAVTPPLIDQTTTFIEIAPNILNSLGIEAVLRGQIASQLVSQLGAVPAQAARVTVSVFSNFLAVITTLIFAFYLLLARDKLDDQMGYFFGSKRRRELERIIDLLEKNLGSWARGQLALMIIVGIATYIGLTLLGVPFAVPLAILAGILEIIPYFGPIFSAVPAVIIGFGISPLIGSASIALYFLVQQLENYVLVPKVMQKTVGVNPVITLLALAIGFRLAGLVGIIISVPLVITIQLLYREYFLNK